jgi:hypothetical protein
MFAISHALKVSVVPEAEIQWQELDAGKQPLVIGSSADIAVIGDHILWRM